MPVGSLTRFTVPLSVNQSAGEQGLLMPKLKYRFRVTLDGFGLPGDPTTEITKQVMNVSRPDISFDEIKLDVYNSRIKLAGKHTLADPKLVVRDDATGAVSKLIGRQMQKQLDFYEQASAASGIDYKFIMRVEILDGGNGMLEPITLESFEYVGCYINQVVYAEANYAESAAMDITLTLKADNVIQLVEPGGAVNGIGEMVGRTFGTMSTG